MADLTQGAVDSLVGLLATVITKEVRLQKGVQRDMQFIKDEMESMNGFLIHLTKTDGMHDNQLRAWMKQIRDISYIAQDCVELYKHDFPSPSGRGLQAFVKYLPMLLWRCCARHRLAKRINELKVRVHDVGQRRERYGVIIPTVEEPPLTLAEVRPSQDEIDEAREEFARALARDKKKQELPVFKEAILLVNKDLQSAATDVRRCLHKNLSQDRSAAVCMEMLLRALWDHSDVHRAVEKTKGELKKLVKEAGMDIKDFPTQVMIFCYSKLSRSYKSCLQYLYAFHDEASISRTSLVRRWLAEGRVEKQVDASLKEVEKQVAASLEEVAEICFKDLLFRGFLLPADDPTTATCKVKSCTIDDIIWKFLHRMSTTENFVDNLPTHLEYQLRIRRYVKRQAEQLQKNHPRPRHPWSICGRGMPPPDDNTAVDPNPMVDMLNFLECLHQAYRLNVLDLGGCKGLQKRHLKSICKVVSLKYLSLRNTDVSHLPWEINNLIMLETLDIRETKVRGRHMNYIYLRKLKHLLTSLKMTTEEETLCWAGMPGRIGKMEDMEILSRVQVWYGKKEFEEVGRLLKLRKLGVVLVGSQSQAQYSMINLLRAITKLRECLRSLSIWVTPPSTNVEPSVTLNMEMTSEQSAPKLLKSLNIKGVRFPNSRLPRWICELHLLSEITLWNTFLSKDSLQDLGNNLHHLHFLRLRRNSYNEHKLTFSKDGFQDLRFLIIEGDIITTVDFEEDITTHLPQLKKILWRNMAVKKEAPCPQLKKIVWRNMAINQAGTLSGICHLDMLKEVELKGHFTDSSFIPHSNGCKPRHEP
ncbi:hypothetical protein VPH35_140474 [Triticum aestivum]|nr:disease resistance protein PIK6-NP-like [Triticum aestivum]